MFVLFMFLGFATLVLLSNQLPWVHDNEYAIFASFLNLELSNNLKNVIFLSVWTIHNTKSINLLYQNADIYIGVELHHFIETQISSLNHFFAQFIN